jgi:predicted glycoside hydrolase/deacetylase ChbG (UPF0249 family)
MTHKLIVNADDYGHTMGVSEGIRQAHLQGIVTSTTAMMNRPAALDELPKAVALCPRLGLGVHLVLTTGTPVLPAESVRTLVDGDGRFNRRGELIEHLGQIDLDQVDAEWHAQVERFVKVTGRNPDHLDSHHHSSYFSPGLFERMLKLADELHCPIRNPFGDVSNPMADYLPGGQPEKDLAAVKTLLENHKPQRPQHFFSNFYDETVSVENLTNLLTQVSSFPANQTCEIMCHPAVVTDELRQISDYSDMRGVELKVVTGSKLPALLQALDIELVSF